jgi:ABC-type phosphate transport system substrate-binding protein
MNRTTLAAAIAAVLAGGSALAAGPTVGDIAGVPAANTINIAGSSAFKAALLANLETNFCGGANYTVVTSNGSDKNFTGISCTPGTSVATNSGLYNVWIRYEGGSVSGYLPIVNNVAIKQIDGPSLTANPITINGISTGNGTDDSFSVSAGGALKAHLVDLGIGDVEPKALVGNNYPTAYVTSVWGPQNPTGLFGTTATRLVNEVYALFVNENSSAFTETPLSLSQETVGQILSGGYKNWTQVTDTSGNQVASSSLSINIVNREAGSGSRAATDILEVGDTCGGNKALHDASGATDYFSTGDVLTAANSVPGAISYATIDQQYPAGSTSFPNLTMVTLNGVVPSNLAAASGTYPFWVEASFLDNSLVTSADDKAIKNIISFIQDQNTTSSLLDINVVPNFVDDNGTTVNTTVHANASLSGIVPTGTGNSVTVYINPFTRGDITCSTPSCAINTDP